MGSNEIAVIYGNEPELTLPRLLDHLNIPAELPTQGRIGIKPNLVLAKPSSSGATTDPRIVDVLVGYLKERGFDDLVIMESAWVGDSTRRAFQTCGYTQIAEKHGVPLVDLKQDATRRLAANGFHLDVCETALDVQYLINIPVLKAHCQTQLTCALKNLKGCIPDREKRRYHTLGLHQPIAALAGILRSDLIIVDGIVGDLTFEEGGTPVEMNRIIAGRDPVLIDAYGATLLGYAPEEISYIGLAEAHGLGSADLGRATISELNQGSDTPLQIGGGENVRRLLCWLDQNMACSACVGSALHALMRFRGSHGLESLPGKIKIGQGYLGRVGPEVGIGTCTSGLERNVEGCPPGARKILNFIEELAGKK